MEAKELRIGNYILDYEAEPEVSIYWKVEEIQRLSNDKALNQTIGVTYRKGSCWTCDPQPIPLTEEWLVKFSFERTSYGREFKGFHLEASSRVLATDLLSGFSWEQVVDEKYLRILYVHQLQNLYFALTNEELKLK